MESCVSLLLKLTPTEKIYSKVSKICTLWQRKKLLELRLDFADYYA